MRSTMVGKFFGVVITSLLLAGAAQAMPLDLVPQKPDFSSGNLLVEYDATSDIFEATGFVTQLEFNSVGGAAYQGGPGGNFTSTATGYQLEAVIDQNGNIDPNQSTVSISGTFTAGPLEAGVPDLSGISGTLLTAKLSQFGFTDMGSGISQFEFAGEVTGGAVAQYFGGVGQPFGVIMDPNFPSAPTGFENDFSNDIAPGFGVGQGFADNAKVPEPASAMLIAFGSALLGRRRRK